MPGGGGFSTSGLPLGSSTRGRGLGDSVRRGFTGIGGTPRPGLGRGTGSSWTRGRYPWMDGPDGGAE